MRTFFKYLRPYRWVVMLALLLAAINQSFSMLDPYFFGKLGMDNLAAHPYERGYYERQVTVKSDGSDGKPREQTRMVWKKTSPRSQAQFVWDVMRFLGIVIGVAMVSRIAKAFQDYYGQIIVQKFGATIFTDGLRHSMGLPFTE
ncbi:MAG TPA: hypothetical protein VKU83_10020, partial [Puia sp.]|nr:hypothetical protein [Puia sp.]